MVPIRILVVLAVLALLAGAGIVYSGAYNVAADEPHWPVTHGLLDALKERSIAARAGAIEVPADLDDAGRMRRGAGNYEAMCVGCHLRPGVHDSEIRKGLYPQPPDLAQPIPGRDPAAATTAAAAARQFWIIKHGIKASGMPAWSKGGMDDAAIWDLVALLRKLPALDGTEYVALVAASEGHSHAGAEGGHADPPGAPPHSHEKKRHD
jgi:mono/diheme cytochrome c family protein